MTEVISVRFRGGSKNYYFDPNGLTVRPDQYVIVETSQGLEYVCCVEGNHEVSDQSVVQPLRPVVRLATDADHKTAAHNIKREKEAFSICEKKIADHKLEMKLVNVECNFEGSKIIFFFTAEGRVDFRELVKDLAGIFRARIELRQIGVRDEAKMLGGLGICGRPLCCNQFMDDFIPVSIKMAKTQNLSLNPTKISGSCGRLMCCLKYEQNAYEDAAKRMPKNDSFVDTPDGLGNVSNVDLLREQVTVRLDESPEAPKKYKVTEIHVLRNGKGSRDGIEIPSHRPARHTPAAEDSIPSPEARPARRVVLSHDLPDITPTEEIPASEEKQEHTSARRRHRGGRKHSGDKVKTAEKQAKEPAAVKETPVKAEKPVKQEKPKAEKKSESGRSHRRSGKGAKSESTPEKIPVRTVSDTTAEKKAAADRAARHQAPEAKTGEGEHKSAHRRHHRHRPRGKKPDGGQGEAQ